MKAFPINNKKGLTMHTYDYGLEWKNMKIVENARERLCGSIYVSFPSHLIMAKS